MITISVYFSQGFTVTLPLEAVKQCSDEGDCSITVKYWAREIPKEAEDLIRAELKEYGGWTLEELQDNESNWQRIVWIAANNIRDEFRYE